MQNPNTLQESLKQHILTAGLISAVGAAAAGALKLDHYFGSRDIAEDPHAEPEFVFHNQPGSSKTLVLLGGLCMGTEHVAKRYKSQLDHNVSLVAPIFPDAGFSPLKIFEKTYQKLEETNPDEVVIAGLSMGGPLSWDLLNYGLHTGREELVEKVSTLILRGSPMDKNAIRLGPRTLVNMMNTLGYSYTLEHGRPLLRRWNLNSIANAPATKIVPQCKYLAGEHAGPLSVMPKRVLWIRGAQHDPVVDEDYSIKVLERKLGRSIEQIVDKECIDKKHAPTDKKSAWFMLSAVGIAKPHMSMPHIPFTPQMLPQAA